MVSEAITLAATVAQAGSSAGIDWLKVLGLRPKGGAGGNDPGYVAAVATDMSAEYNAAQSALNSARNDKTKQAIIDAYNAEKAAWGDPSNPNRNVAIGQTKFAAQISSILSADSNYDVTVPVATGADETPKTTIVAANNQADTSAAYTSAAVNTVKTSNPLVDNAPIIIIVIGILIVVLVLNKKGK
ncbi:MAG: hypothetical protein PHS46_08460 [Candidatus Omnitrophica bacterium]|nr:hypothetical protein [Candidatus Omnitrophota bacterium]